MSKADELLASLAESEDPAYPVDSTGEEHIIVNSDRTVTVPESLRRIAVQHDHNVETVTFDCPRYWDDHDMSQMPVYINYMLADGRKGAYIADNVRVDDADPNIMHFDWTISNYVTWTPGAIAFLICVKKVDVNTAELVNHWNSELCSQLYISEGMECVLDIILPQVDIITQLLALIPEMQEAVANASNAEAAATEAATRANTISTAAETAEQARVSAEEARAAAEAAREETFATYTDDVANTLVASTKGEVVRVDDVSPIEHRVRAKVGGKNLLSFDKPLDINSTYHSWSVNPNHKTVTMSLTDKDTSVDITGMYLGLCGNGINGNGGVIWLVERGVIKRTTCTVTDYEYVSIYEDSSNDGVATALSSRFNIQVEYGTEATEYEPYIDPTTVTITGCGKNLLNLGNKAGDISGIYRGWMVNPTGDDVTVSLVDNDTSVEMSDVYFGFTDTGVDATGDFTGWIVHLGELTAKSRTSKLKYVSVYPNDDATIDKLTSRYRIQVELGSAATDYEPYKSSAYTPAADGSVDIRSVSPTMTILTDTPGVTIEAEYNVDTNKAIENVNADIRALDNSVAELAEDVTELTANPPADGVSPTVTVAEITNGHRVTITDATGTVMFDVMDGAQGPAGPQGDPYSLTDADKTDIVDQVLAALPNGDEVYY